MTFSIASEVWAGGLPSVEARTANTVWGAIFNVPKSERTALAAREAAEGRKPSNEFVAIDRAGGRYEVVAFVAEHSDGEVPPSVSYMQKVVDGARHWGLPGGWVAGLEEFLEGPLI